MKTTLRFDRSDIRNVRDMVGAAGVSLKNCSELFQDVIDDVQIPSAARTFDAEGRPQRWQALSEAYALRKARRVGHTQILVYGGDLRESVATEKGNRYTVREVGPRRMLFGTKRPWAEVHQVGGSRVPTRPFLVIQNEDLEKMLDMTLDWVIKTGRYEGRNE